MQALKMTLSPMDSPSQVDVLVPIVMGRKYGDATAGKGFHTNTDLRHSFYIKANRGNRGHNFPQLELVQNCCLARRCKRDKRLNPRKKK